MSKIIHIKNWMSSPVATVTEENTIEEAIKIMTKKDIGCVLVVKGKKPVGIFTERDVLRKVLLSKLSLDTPVKNVMSKKVQTAGYDTTIVQISKMMSKYHFRRVVIVNDDGEVKGIITSRDLMEFLSA